MLDLDGFVATTRVVREQDTEFTLTEEVNLQDKERFITQSTDEAGFEILHVKGGTSYLKGFDFVDPELIGDRWVRLNEDQLTHVLEGFEPPLRAVVAGKAAEGLVRALQNPGKTTTIGREVVNGKATSHFLTRLKVKNISEASLPVEAWVSDGGDLIRIKALIQTAGASASELEMDLRRRASNWESRVPSDGAQLAFEDLSPEQSRFDKEAKSAEEAEAGAESLSASLVDFTDREMGFSIKHPSKWKRSERDDPEIRLLVKDEGLDSLLVRVARTPAPFPPNLTGEEAKQIADVVLKRETFAPERILREQAVNVNGSPGYYYLYTFEEDVKTDNGVKKVEGVHAHYFVFSGRRVFVLVFQALPTANFDKLAATFDAMAETFRVVPVASDAP